MKFLHKLAGLVGGLQRLGQPAKRTRRADELLISPLIGGKEELAEGSSMEEDGSSWSMDCQSSPAVERSSKRPRISLPAAFKVRRWLSTDSA